MKNGCLVADEGGRLSGDDSASGSLIGWGITSGAGSFHCLYHQRVKLHRIYSMEAIMRSYFHEHNGNNAIVCMSPESCEGKVYLKIALKPYGIGGFSHIPAKKNLPLRSEVQTQVMATNVSGSCYSLLEIQVKRFMNHIHQD